MKKLLNILTTMSLSSGLILNSTACTSPNSDPNSNTDTSTSADTSTNTQLINLSDIIRITDLGITMVGTTPNETKVLADIKTKNPTANTLTENDFKIIQVSNNNITITGINKYKGEVTLKYKKQTVKTDLNNIILNKDLGEIYVGQANKPALEQIKTEIKKKNPTLNITSINILDSDITTTTVIVTGDGNQYTGIVKVEFTITNFEEINAKIGNSISNITIDNKGNIYVSAKGYVYKSTDGSNFTKMSKHFANEISGLVADNIGNIYVSNNIGEVFIHTHNSVNQNEFEIIGKMKDKTNEITSISIDENNNLYAGTLAGNVYKHNGTYGFQLISGTKSGNWTKINSLVYGGAGNLYAVNKQGEIYESINGADFKQAEGTSGSIFTHLAVGKNNYIYAITNLGDIFCKYFTGPFRQLSKTDGLTSVSSLMIDKNSGIIYIGNGSSVFRSNGTNKFTPMSGMVWTVNALAIDQDGNLYAGNENGGFYKSTKLI